MASRDRKKVLVPGAGATGTTLAYRFAHRLPRAVWPIPVVDPAGEHLKWPGLLFLPVGAHDDAAMQRPRERTLAHGIARVRAACTRWIERSGIGDELAHHLLSRQPRMRHPGLVLANAARTLAIDDVLARPARPPGEGRRLGENLLREDPGRADHLH